MDISRINKVISWLCNLVNRPNALQAPVMNSDVINIREEILLICKDVETEHCELSKRLNSAKERIFFNQQMSWNSTMTFINPTAIGQTIEILNVLKDDAVKEHTDWWSYVHPRIRKVSEKLYKDGSYANAACDAFVEINVRVKQLFMQVRPGEVVPDGDAAMKQVFSAKSPIIEFCDRSNDSGANIQKGYMEMLAGAMSALRNPKAHANIIISSDDAMRRLIFASMLMYEIDEAVSYNRLVENSSSSYKF